MESNKPLAQQAWDLRNAYISLPPKDSASDYRRLLLVGRTGAGKTTLVRQLLGVSHSFNFPPTSQNRTTVADFEAVFTEKGSSYKCVVTFLGKNIVYEYIKDCLFEAANKFFQTNDFNKSYNLFLEHKTQRFRLKYILGDATKTENLNASLDYKKTILTRGIKYKKYITNISEHISQENNFALTVFDKKAYNDLSKQEKREFDEYIYTQTTKNDDFIVYCNDIIKDIIELVFDAGKCGKFQNDSSGWPQVFTYENNQKDTFISNILRFCGNSGKDHGKLASPVVSGIRVSGPFHPRWSQYIPKIVIIDGEGIGHNSDRFHAISTSITEKYSLADNIFLIDSATEPMLNEAQSAALSIIAHGYSEELFFAFTKFDSIEGINYQDDDDRKQHILMAIENFADSCNDDDNLGIEVRDILENIADTKTIFLSSLNKDISLESSLKNPLLELLTLSKVYFFDGKVHCPKNSSIPSDNKEKSIQKKTLSPKKQKIFKEEQGIKLLKEAIQNFHDKWDGYLNFGSPARVPSQHWTRIKALTRRVAEFGWDSYDNLDPVADAVDFLQKSLLKLLKQNEIDKKVLNDILKLCSQENHDLCRRELITLEHHRWCEAYYFSGPGSTSLRAAKIRSIYKQRMPVSESNIVIKAILEIVKRHYS
ncbi:hypothetical protein QUW15_03655 [Desulfovibrio piger]|nr:hypothetical protein [Desulfovibrio piger]